MEQTYKNKVIEAATLTNKKYRKFIKDLKSQPLALHNLKYNVGFGTTSRCSYCQVFIVVQGIPNQCINCPLNEGSDYTCVDHKTYTNMSQAFSSNNIEKIIEATKARIRFHKEIINHYK